MKDKVKKSLKKYGIILVTTLLTTGCIQTKQENPETVLPDQKEERVEIAPSVQVEEKYYRGLSPFKPSSTRGSLFMSSTLDNYRLDADRLELGLLEIAQDHFPIDTHLFSEGQFITNEDLSAWLDRKGKNKLGLNPDESEGRILRHILEHNYTNLEGEVEGIVIGLSLASTYQKKQDDKTTTLLYTDDELRNFGIEMSAQIAERLRKKAPNIPIVIALYRLEESTSLVPGNFLSYGFVEANQQSVGNWKTIHETYLLFPSQALSNHDRELANQYDTFRQEIEDFYPNYVGVIGVGRFIDEKLVELTFNVSTEFSSKTEVIQLTQFLGGSAIEIFPKDVHMNIYLQSVNQPKSIFVRPVEGDNIIHVYR